MVAQLYRYLGRITDAQQRDALGVSGARQEDADRFAVSLRERIERVHRGRRIRRTICRLAGRPAGRAVSPRPLSRVTRHSSKTAVQRVRSSSAPSTLSAQRPTLQPNSRLTGVRQTQADDAPQGCRGTAVFPRGEREQDAALPAGRLLLTRSVRAVHTVSSRRHSRNATVGFNLTARIAGTILATLATAISNTPTDANVTGSSVLTP